MYHAFRKNNQNLRVALFKAHHERCAYCGRVMQQRDLQVDHIVPVSLGKYDDEVAQYLEELNRDGFIVDSIENYLPSCQACNREKSNRPLSAANLRFFHEKARWHTEAILKYLEKSEQSSTWQDLEEDAQTPLGHFPVAGADLSKQQAHLQREPIYGNPNHILADIFVHHSVKRTIGRQTDHFESVIDAYKESCRRTEHRMFLLLGDYGVGKSSSLKMLASKYNDGSYLYVSLKDVLVSAKSIHDGIIEYCRRKYRISLDFMALQECVVLLLDGFDELQRHNSDSEEELLFKQIKNLTDYEHVKVILASRSTAFINSPHLLNIPTLYMNDYDDQQVDTWICNWKRINSEKKLTISIAGLKERNLLDICRNKLILYMVARIYDDELQEARRYTKAYVYKCFFDWTIDGKFKEDSEYTIERYHGSQTYDKETYRRILRDIALIITQCTNNEIIPVKRLEEELRKFQREEINSEIFNFTQHLFTRHFFSTQKDGEQLYVEFSHKSLREYIYAEKIFSHLMDICADTPSNELWGDWYQFGRNQRLAKEVFEFLEEMLSDLPADSLLKIGKKMHSCAIILLITRGDFKRYIDGITDREKAIVNISESFHRSLVLSVIAGITNHICYNLLRERFPETAEKLSLVSCDMIYKICDYHLGTSTLYFAMYAVFLQFVKYIRIHEQDVANAQYIKTNLRSFEIVDGMLFRGILQDSVIDQVHWLCVDFSIMKFEGVEITSGTIEGCSFESCMFDNVEFRNVNFKDVRFDILREGTVRFENCSFENTSVGHYLTADTSNPRDLTEDICE